VEGQDRCPAATFLHQPDGSSGPSARFDGQLSVSWLVDCRGLYEYRTRRNRQCCAGTPSRETNHRPISRAPAPGPQSFRLRISLAAHVPSDDGIRTQRHHHGCHQRAGYCAVGFDGQGERATRISAAGRKNAKFRSTQASSTARGPRRSQTRRRATKSRAIAL